jgi:hypothetical protein
MSFVLSPHTIEQRNGITASKMLYWNVVCHMTLKYTKEFIYNHNIIHLLKVKLIRVDQS